VSAPLQEDNAGFEKAAREALRAGPCQQRELGELAKTFGFPFSRADRVADRFLQKRRKDGEVFHERSGRATMWFEVAK
jgi:hypothetical protein